MNEQIDKTRRHLILGSGIGLLSLPAWSAGRLLTPRQTAGPFYPDLPLPDKDSDLTKISGKPGIATGEITDLSGQVFDAGGNPLDSVRIEIWQCDANGRYRHSGDNQEIAMDPYFQGFGHTLTDQMGRYRFRTIRPVSYPGRTPHIHAAVFRQGMRPFVTQIYIADDPRNADDFLFQQIPVELRPLAVTDFVPSTQNGTRFSANFDFVLF